MMTMIRGWWIEEVLFMRESSQVKTCELKGGFFGMTFYRRSLFIPIGASHSLIS
jgi:hypothetical protein